MFSRSDDTRVTLMACADGNAQAQIEQGLREKGYGQGDFTLKQPATDGASSEVTSRWFKRGNEILLITHDFAAASLIAARTVPNVVIVNSPSPDFRSGRFARDIRSVNPAINIQNLSASSFVI